MIAKENIVEFEGVNTRFDETWALRDVSLALKPGETRIIFGAAGSGKTTLLKSVIGLVRVDSGTIKLFDQGIESLSEHSLFPLRAKAGFLFQEGGLFDSLTIGENVAYPLLNQKGRAAVSIEEADRRAHEALRFVELEHTVNKFPNEVSGGMRRRVGIARAIVTEPPLVLYDSPTAGLDPITANTIMAVIAKERDVRNSASLIVTHRYQDGQLMADFRYDAEREELLPIGHDVRDDAKRMRTKFVVMKEGSIVFVGSREELGSATDPYIQRFGRH
ncbi:MAG: ATP-binding cassette domain-containing protein [Bryobacteraceae bacterium]